MQNEIKNTFIVLTIRIMIHSQEILIFDNQEYVYVENGWKVFDFNQNNISNYTNGYYTVALVCDGQIVDAKTLIKN